MMRIEALAATAVTPVGADTGTAAKPAAGNSSNQSAGIPQDTTSLGISPVPSLTSQALASAEARAAKVEALRLAVASAQYTVDPALIADALIGVGA